MKKKILFFAGLALLTMKTQAQTVTDYDGHIYNTVAIGTQIWMKENLKVCHYNNGDKIPLVIDNSTWGSLSSGGYCFYNNDSMTYSTTYGKLYNFYTVVDTRKICPSNWHVPSNDEWLTLATYLGGYSDASTGGKMKEIGTAHWLPPNTGATNSSGFTGLPGGFRRSSSSFGWIDTTAAWWSITPYSCGGFDWVLRYDAATINTFGMPSNSGYSVRCINNSGVQINEINYQDKIKLYPNPITDRVYVNCSDRQNLKMQIYNVIGECIIQIELNIGMNDIDVSSLSKGIYVIKISSADWTVQKKLIKE